jgi:hypothetical protein
MVKSWSFLFGVSLAAVSMSVSMPVGAQVRSQQQGSALIFSPEVFFLGHTEGVGSLKIMFGPRRPVRVHGRGRIAADGSLVLEQDIEQAGKPMKHRRWMMQSLGGGRYAATLSDATGPVIGAVEGNVMKLNFPAKGGLRIRQVLTLAKDRRSARNRLTIRKFGIVVATLAETITRLD